MHLHVLHLPSHVLQLGPHLHFLYAFFFFLPLAFFFLIPFFFFLFCRPVFTDFFLAFFFLPFSFFAFFFLVFTVDLFFTFGAGIVAINPLGPSTTSVIIDAAGGVSNTPPALDPNPPGAVPNTSDRY
ncbi:hypothetical protein HRU45_03250 [Candidatus Dependentiae bacterium]|nr:hypothetical protein [Candidatus Dependentiae bacterium]